MRVISFRHHQDEVVTTLEALCRDARAGRINGIVYACRYGPRARHKLGMSGVYAHDVVQAIGISSWLLRQLHKIYEDHADRPD